MKDYETWIRPDGSEITTNTKPANVEYARSHGWVLKIEADRSKTVKVERSTQDIDE